MAVDTMGSRRVDSYDAGTATGTSGDVTRQIAVIVTIISTVIFNAVSQIARFGGTDNGELAASFERLYILPANRAFSIWSVIYTFLFAYMVYQALPSQKANPKLRKIGWLVVANGVLNMLWLVAFQFRYFAISILFMLGILGTLILIYVRINDGSPIRRRERWLVHVPFSIYLGWICVATIVNIASFLTDARWDGFGIDYVTWTAIMLVVAAVLGSIIAITRRDAALVLVFVWAFFWIFERQQQIPVVPAFALGLAGLIAVVLAVSVFNRKPTVELV